MDQKAAPTAPARAAPLKRSMWMMGVLLLTLSGVTPASSVFIGVPQVISEAGTGALVSMLIGALLVAPIACVYAELSSAFPIAGGEYALVGRTLGPAPGFVILGLTVAVNMLSPAVLALGVATNLQSILPGLDPTWTAEAVIALTTLLGVMHIRTNAWVTGVFLALELLALLALTALGALHAHRPLTGLIEHPVMMSGGAFHPTGAAAIGLSVSVAIFVYNGFGSAVYFAEEMHEAPRLVARTILWAGLISVLTVFLPVLAVLLGAPDLKALLGSDMPFYTFLTATGGGWLKTAVGLAVALAILNAVLATVLQNARFFYSSGRDEVWHPVINAAFQATHPRFDSPWIATLAAGGSAMLMCFIGLDRLLVLTGAGLAVTYAALCVAALVGRIGGRTSGAAWRMPLAPLVAGLGFAGSAYALWAEALDPDVGRLSLIATAAFLAVSALYYAAVIRRRGVWEIRDPL
jgi:amino acid transporter